MINICTKVLGYSSCSTFRVCTESACSASMKKSFVPAFFKVSINIDP